jgi:two-component system, OmpR family, response regulator MtrA
MLCAARPPNHNVRKESDRVTEPATIPRVTSLKVLVVDDEPAMVGVIGAILGGAGHRIVAAYSGEEALRRFREEDPDVVLLDLAMPGLDGALVCREIRATSDTPIIIVSGETDVGVTVELLEAGADDFLRKPFRGDELLARVHAVVRRGRRSPSRHAWAIDRTRVEVLWQGVPFSLTVTEFRLAARLVERIGEVVETAELLAVAWPGVVDPDPLWLKPHMARLRAKLIASGAPPPVAVRGVGYRLPAEPAEPTEVVDDPQVAEGATVP